jgi:hypothetical protein
VARFSFGTGWPEVSIPLPPVRRYGDGGDRRRLTPGRETMRYLLAIYGSEREWSEASEADNAAVMAAYDSFTKDIVDRGLFQAGEALQPTSTATTVRVRDGRTLTTDGPFAETKEQLGGYYVVDCKDLDEAIEVAAKIPGADGGSIEVRPIMEFPARD